MVDVDQTFFSTFCDCKDTLAVLEITFLKQLEVVEIRNKNVIVNIFVVAVNCRK